MECKALCHRQPYGRACITKTLWIMQWTTILILSGCLQLSAAGYSQPVSLSGRDIPLKKVFAAITKQTGYVVFYDYQLLSECKPVTVAASNVALEDFLTACLHDQPLDFSIEGRMITIVRRKVSVFLETRPVEAMIPPDLRGRVTDSAGHPLAGASVTVKGAKKGTQTDADGKFELKGVSGNVTLVISFTGYATREVRINGTDVVNISLSRSVSPLDEIQIIAYGQTTQRFNLGNVTTVSSADIEKQPVTNVLLALEGRVPGLFITQATGLPGSAINILIQGQNSIGSGNDPLYVIDGVPYPSQLLPSDGAGVLGRSGVNVVSQGNSLSYINPDDIESISVLKDADATAIYGSLAANGAVLITTKKGKAGDTRLDFNLQNGWGNDVRRMPLLNMSQFLTMRHEAIRNDKISVKPTDYDINGFWDTTRTTDWQKTLVGGTAGYMDLNGTVSGGTAHNQYLVGATYNRETTVFPGDFADQRGGLHFAINSATANEKFHLQLTGSYLLDNNRLPGVDLTPTAVSLAPNAPALYNADGSLNWMPNSSGSSSWSNPLADLRNTYHDKTTNTMASAQISYELLQGLVIRGNLGYNNLQSDELTENPLSAVNPTYLSTAQNYAIYAHNNINSWSVEPQLNYKHRLWKGRVDVLAGVTIRQRNSDGSNVLGMGYNSDLSLGNMLAASNIYADDATIATYRYNALFGRLNYNLLDKYIIEITARRDGSSRFGPANEFHDFASAAAGWIFTQEQTVKDHLPFLSFGKLNVSYGTMGNDQIGDYAYLSTYRSVVPTVPYQGVTGLTPNGIPNPFLQWEETRKLSAGLELGFVKDRLLLHVNYNRNRSSNELLTLAYPSLIGFTTLTQNLAGTVQNKGWELTLQTVNIKTRDIEWTTHFNLTIPRNQLIAFPGLAQSLYADYLVIGKSIGVQKQTHLLGVDPATGQYQIADKHGQPTQNPVFPDDYTSLFDPFPKFFGGLDNQFRFKQFQLSVFFQFTKQKGTDYSLGNLPGLARANQPVWVLDRWQKPGDHARNQLFDANQTYYNSFENGYNSDATHGDASYIRLKNLSFSWSLPHELAAKAHVRNAQLYAQGQNLLTLTHFKGLDPETLTVFSLPPLRILTLGLKLGL